MEENINGRKKSEPLIPANYVSILQLQQQWLKEKEWRQKEKEREREREREGEGEEEEQRLKRQLEGREEDREKVEAEKQLKEVGEGVERRKLNKKDVDRRNRRLSSRNGWRKKPGVGREPIRKKAEESKVMATVRDNGVETTPEDEKLREDRRKKKKSSKRKKNQTRIKEDLIGGESYAPLLNKPIPLNKPIRGVYKPKAENAKQERDAPHNAVKDLTAEIEKKVEGITIGGGEGRGDTRTSKSSAMYNRRNHSNSDNKRNYQRPLRRSRLKGPTNAKLVWVKKEQTQEDPGDSGTVNL